MAGLRAAGNTWQSSQLPLEQTHWDLYNTRLIRYWLNEAYYSNIIYDSINNYATAIKAGRGLYSHIRPIYNPVSRLVDTYESKIYPGAINLDNLGSGAIPISADDELLSAIKRLLMWSNWNTQKGLYVRHGEKLGDSFIKVIDDRNAQRVRLEVLRPEYVKFIRTDEAGNIKEIHIEYDRLDRENAIVSPDRAPSHNDDTYTYTEIITQETFSTYRDGEPYAFYLDRFGNGVSEWRNIYGFVPVTHAMAVSEGFEYGSTRFNNSKVKIDEINDQASVINDQVRKTINPVWGIFGAKATNLDLKESDRQVINTLNFPEGSDAKALIADINIEDALANLQSMLQELEKDMPELTLHQARNSGNVSGVALRNMFSDAASRMQSAMSNYDDPFIRACQMAISIGAMGRYRDFEPFSAQSYERGDLDFHINPRPVFEDELSKVERITFLLQSGAPKQAIWSEMDIAKDVQVDWQGQALRDSAMAIRRQARQANPQIIEPFVPSEGESENVA